MLVHRQHKIAATSAYTATKGGAWRMMPLAKKRQVAASVSAASRIDNNLADKRASKNSLGNFCFVASQATPCVRASWGHWTLITSSPQRRRRGQGPRSTLTCCSRINSPRTTEHGEVCAGSLTLVSITQMHP